MAKLRFNISELLTRKRECDVGWLLLQAECLCRFAKEKHSHSALVYAALETRNAIEQLFFTLLVVCRPPSGITRRDLDECRKKGGVFRVFKRFAPEYEKLVDFTQVCLGIEADAPRVIKWNIQQLEKYCGRISEFCHYQGIPNETTEANFNAWLSRGIALVEEVFEYLESRMSCSHTGIMRVDGMPPEVKAAWEDFRNGKISASDLKLRLELMQPALRRRRLLYPQG